MAFQLDTSGAVQCEACGGRGEVGGWAGGVASIDGGGGYESAPCGDCKRGLISFSDLKPLQQGAVEAALREFIDNLDPRWKHFGMGFKRLAPATLARIMDIATRMAASHGNATTAQTGAIMWTLMQKGEYPGLPPLALFLGGDGLIHIKEPA